MTEKIPEAIGITHATESMSEGFRSGFVAIIGRPNVGKLTLLNHLIGQKISIISRKAQTKEKRGCPLLLWGRRIIVFAKLMNISANKINLSVKRSLKSISLLLVLSQLLACHDTSVSTTQSTNLEAIATKPLESEVVIAESEKPEAVEGEAEVRQQTSEVVIAGSKTPEAIEGETANNGTVYFTLVRRKMCTHDNASL